MTSITASDVNTLSAVQTVSMMIFQAKVLHYITMVLPLYLVTAVHHPLSVAVLVYLTLAAVIIRYSLQGQICVTLTAGQ